MNWKLHKIRKTGFSIIKNNIGLFSEKLYLGYTHDKNLNLNELNGAMKSKYYLQPMVSSKLMITVQDIIQSIMIWI